MNAGGVIRVEDLLRSPALQLGLLAGGGGIARKVAWAHVSELNDPTPWLFGSELIMTTGMAIPADPIGQRAYLGRLDNAGVAGLALSDGLFVPRDTSGLLAEADDRQFPVVRVPIPVPFMAVAQEVAAAVQANTAQAQSAQLQVFGAVRWLATGELSTAAIFSRLERLSGYALYACTPKRRPLLDGVPMPPDELAHLVPAAASSPPTIPGGYVLPVTGARGTAGYILAHEKPDARPGGVSVVQHIATVAALTLAMQAHEREIIRRERAELFSEILQGALDRQAVIRRLTANGFSVSDQLLLVIVRVTDPNGDIEAIADTVTLGGFPHLVLRQYDDLYLLVPDVPGPSRLLAGLRGTVIGISRPFPATASVVTGRREAQWALTRAAERGHGMVQYGDDQISRWLGTDMADLSALATDVLGPVLDYDAAHAGSLLLSVRTWLERDRNTESAAKALNIHPNTLLYRIRRFEEISGRSLNSTEALTEIWLALRTTASVLEDAQLSPAPWPPSQGICKIGPFTSGSSAIRRQAR
jgi:PucR family transcriptional regulator, purine catabolism regulatory protein